MYALHDFLLYPFFDIENTFVFASLEGLFGFSVVRLDRGIRIMEEFIGELNLNFGE